jgi:hypothetical protein
MRSALVRTVGLVVCVIAVLAATLGLMSTSAAASPFCGGSSVNNANSCFGAARAMSGANAYGETTSVCVGADSINGTCSPGPNQFAIVNTNSGTHYPWVRGNAASFTIAWGNTF